MALRYFSLFWLAVITLFRVKGAD